MDTTNNTASIGAAGAPTVNAGDFMNYLLSIGLFTADSIARNVGGEYRLNLAVPGLATGKVYHTANDVLTQAVPSIISGFQTWQRDRKVA